MFLVTVAMIAFVFFIFAPRDIGTDVSGYPYDPAAHSGQPRNLLREAEDKLVKDEGNLTFTEEQVNTYLNQRLDVTQKGLFGGFTTVEGIYMDFHPNEVTIFIQRKVFGVPFTVDSTWKYYLSNEKYIRECTQSRMGKLTAKGAMLAPVMAPFNRFIDACEREKKLLNDLSLIHI